MNVNRHEAEIILEQTAAEIRNSAADARTVDAALARVHARLADQTHIAHAETLPPDRICTCADFQTLIPGYVGRRLSEARTALFEDHIRECIPCRKALKEFRTGRPVAATAVAHAPRRVNRRALAAAASLLLSASLIGFGWLKYAPTANADAAVIERVEGGVYRIGDVDPAPLRAGDILRAGERIRTGKDARAKLRLSDGSLVELRERTEFSVKPGARGLKALINRGAIIVQAAKRRDGALSVATPDGVASVTGTTFSVNSGVKGSRVSVMEGEVRLESDGKENVLRPGDQMTTSAALARLPIQEEVAWSQDADQYKKLLGELTALRNAVVAQATRPGIRYETGLLNLAPADTAFYAALPNLNETLRSANRIIRDRVQENPALRQWWNESRDGATVERLADRLVGFLDLFGDEIVLTIGGSSKHGVPLILARVVNPERFQAAFEARLAEATAQGDRGFIVEFIGDPTTVAGAGGRDERRAFATVRDGVFALSPDPDALRKVGGGFAQTSFYAAIAEQYRSGVNLLIAGDLERIVATRPTNRADSAFQRLGLNDLKHFILNLRDLDGATPGDAALTFNESQHGIGSWLAAPGPMGALDYVSSNASVVMACVVKNPTALTDDVIAALGAASPAFKAKIAELEARHGLSVRDDFAAPLGGEFALAVDGPALPVPAWKLIVEVYDAARFQHSLERCVEEANRLLVAEGKTPLRWTREESGGRVFYRLGAADGTTEVHFLYADGYFLAAANRTLLERALAYREAGTTLTRSPNFRAALPVNGNANFSALLYQNVGQTLGDVAATLDAGGDGATGESRARAVARRLPTLAYAYAYPNRIVMSAGGPGLSLADIITSNLLSLGPAGRDGQKPETSEERRITVFGAKTLPLNRSADAPDAR
jgi:ferric-dicitrate binding protein FerR (iron transport regulator)